MAKTKKELENELNKIERKLNTLINDFVGIKKNMMSVQKRARDRGDSKRIDDLKKKITTL